ncbi:MIP/aquaporin family protein [Agrococcus versicolor]|uniref:MIP/aquaporin family protein n=1 Tax=Agrococcus versicolor TaxID=501482 RepID=A0ABP5MEP4_9MICO
MDNLGLVLLSETVGTALLLLLGTGVVANVVLAKTKGFGGGFLMINFGWGLAVFAGVLVSGYSGAQLNPAVTIGLVVNGLVQGDEVPWAAYGVAVVGQLLGAFIGAVLAWLTYKQHFDAEEDPAAKLGTFSTGPGIRSYGWNLVTEIIATFVLVFVILSFGLNGADEALTGPLSALAVGFTVVVIGASLGGPTGYAINPARDLAPRIAHAVLPIAGKGDSDWGYAWVPVVGPLIGGALAGALAPVLLASGLA